MRPNVLILMCDQLQARVLEPDSPCRTPHLDRLAARGVRFARAYTPNPVCSPARASLMTGTLPHVHGVLQVNHCAHDYHCDLRADLPHFAGSLRAAGYHTGYFGKWHVDRGGDLGRFGWTVDGQAGSPLWRSVAGGRRGHGELVDAGFVRTPGWPEMLLYGTTRTPPAERGLGIACELAGRFVEESAAASEPWCCLVSLTEPHDPFVCGVEAAAAYDPASLPVPANWHDDLRDRPGLYRRSRRVFAPLTLDQRRRAAACYYGLVGEIDAQFGRLLAWLEATGSAESTLVILTADHGELLGAHGLYQKNVGAFEENYGVPAVWAGPGVAAGAVCDARLGLQDIGPTLLEHLGLAPLPTPGGRSLAHRLAAPAAARDGDDAGYAEYFGTRLWWSQRVIWEGDWKLVWNGFDDDELYDLASDPGELTNRIDDPACAAIVARLAARAWRVIGETDDHPLGRLGYASLRLAPAGPLGAP